MESETTIWLIESPVVMLFILSFRTGQGKLRFPQLRGGRIPDEAILIPKSGNRLVRNPCNAVFYKSTFRDSNFLFPVSPA